MELQQDLISLGHLEGEVDGIIGSGTLEGIRSYQRAKGLAVDGYPTLTILKKLRAEAPPPPPPPPAAPAPVKAENQVVPAAPPAVPASGATQVAPTTTAVPKRAPAAN
jgi:membrane-bound lytic murein transglycosylase B